MAAFKTVAVLGEDRSLTLQQLPFRAGEQVEVIVLPRNGAEVEPTFPLRGLPVRYDQPIEPVAVDEWEALRAPS